MSTQTKSPRDTFSSVFGDYETPKVDTSTSAKSSNSSASSDILGISQIMRAHNALQRVAHQQSKVEPSLPDWRDVMTQRPDLDTPDKRQAFYETEFLPDLVDARMNGKLTGNRQKLDENARAYYDRRVAAYEAEHAPEKTLQDTIDAGRTTGEIVQDSALALGKGIADSVEGIYGLARLGADAVPVINPKNISKGIDAAAEFMGYEAPKILETVDEKVYDTFNAAKQFYRENLSPKTRAQYDQFDAIEGLDAGLYYLKNPTFLVQDFGLAQVPQLLFSYGLGSLATKGASAVVKGSAAKLTPVLSTSQRSSLAAGTAKVANWLDNSVLAPGAIGEGLLSSGSTYADLSQDNKAKGQENDWKTILLSLEAGGVTTGVTLAGGKVAGTVGKKLGIDKLTDIDALTGLLTGRVSSKNSQIIASTISKLSQETKIPEKSLLKEFGRQLLVSIPSESAEEVLQTANETIATNLYKGKPWDDGLAKQLSAAAVGGGALGGMGSVIGSATGAKTETKKTLIQPKPEAPVVEDTTEKVAEDKAEKVAEDTTEKVAEDKAEKVAEDTTEKVAEDTTEKVAEDKAEKVAEDKAEKVAEDKTVDPEEPEVPFESIDEFDLYGPKRVVNEDGSVTIDTAPDIADFESKGLNKLNESVKSIFKKAKEGKITDKEKLELTNYKYNAVNALFDDVTKLKNKYAKNTATLEATNQIRQAEGQAAKSVAFQNTKFDKDIASVRNKIDTILNDDKGLPIAEDLEKYLNKRYESVFGVPVPAKPIRPTKPVDEYGRPRNPKNEYTPKQVSQADVDAQTIKNLKAEVVKPEDRTFQDIRDARGEQPATRTTINPPPKKVAPPAKKALLKSNGEVGEPARTGAKNPNVEAAGSKKTKEKAPLLKRYAEPEGKLLSEPKAEYANGFASVLHIPGREKAGIDNTISTAINVEPAIDVNKIRNFVDNGMYPKEIIDLGKVNAYEKTPYGKSLEVKDLKPMAYLDILDKLSSIALDLEKGKPVSLGYATYWAKRLRFAEQQFTKRNAIVTEIAENEADGFVDSHPGAYAKFLARQVPKENRLTFPQRRKAQNLLDRLLAKQATTDLDIRMSAAKIAAHKELINRPNAKGTLLKTKVAEFEKLLGIQQAKAAAVSKAMQKVLTRLAKAQVPDNFKNRLAFANLYFERAKAEHRRIVDDYKRSLLKPTDIEVDIDENAVAEAIQLVAEGELTIQKAEKPTDVENDIITELANEIETETESDTFTQLSDEPFANFEEFELYATKKTDGAATEGLEQTTFDDYLNLLQSSSKDKNFGQLVDKVRSIFSKHLSTAKIYVGDKTTDNIANIAEKIITLEKLAEKNPTEALDTFVHEAAHIVEGFLPSDVKLEVVQEFQDLRFQTAEKMRKQNPENPENPIIKWLEGAIPRNAKQYAERIKKLESLGPEYGIFYRFVNPSDYFAEMVREEVNGGISKISALATSTFFAKIGKPLAKIADSIKKVLAALYEFFKWEPIAVQKALALVTAKDEALKFTGTSIGSVISAFAPKVKIEPIIQFIETTKQFSIAGGSVAEQIASVAAEPASVTPKQWLDTKLKKMAEYLTDSYTPIRSWINTLPISQSSKDSLFAALYSGVNIASNNVSKIMAKSGNALLTAISKESQRTGYSNEQISKFAGLALTAKWAIKQNDLELAGLAIPINYFVEKSMLSNGPIKDRLLAIKPENRTVEIASWLAQQYSQDGDNEKIVSEAYKYIQFRQAYLDQSTNPRNLANIKLVAGMTNKQSKEVITDIKTKFDLSEIEKTHRVFNQDVLRQKLSAGQISFESILPFIDKKMRDRFIEEAFDTVAPSDFAESRFDEFFNEIDYVQTHGSFSDAKLSSKPGSTFDLENIALVQKSVNILPSLAITAAFQDLQTSRAFEEFTPFKLALFEQLAGLSEQERLAVGVFAGTDKGLESLKSQTISLFIGGEAHGFAITKPKVVEALRGFNMKPTIPIIGDFLSSALRVFGSAITSYNPLFAPINVVKDSIERLSLIGSSDFYSNSNDKISSAKLAKDAFINLLTNGANYFSTGLKYAWTGEISPSRAGDSLSILVANGGLNTRQSLWVKDAESVAKLVAKNSPQGHKKAISMLSKVVHAYNMAFDMMPILASFDAFSANGVSQTNASGYTLDLLNFNKKGTVAPIIQSLWAFARPTMVGAGNTATQIYNPVTGKINRKGVVQLLGQIGVWYGLLSMMAGLDDSEDEYLSLPDSMTAHSLPIPLGKGQYFKFPIGFGLAKISATTAREIFHVHKGIKSPTALPWNIVYDGMLPELTPFNDSPADPLRQPLFVAAQMAMPTLLQPLVNKAFNTNVFGKELIKQPKQGLYYNDPESPAGGLWRDAAEMAHKLSGGFFDPSPMSFKYIAESYTPGVVSELFKAFIDNPHAKSIGKETQLPFASKLWWQANPQAKSSQLYSIINNLYDLEAESSERSLSADEKAKLRFLQQFNSASRQLSQKYRGIAKSKNVKELLKQRHFDRARLGGEFLQRYRQQFAQ